MGIGETIARVPRDAAVALGGALGLGAAALVAHEAKQDGDASNKLLAVALVGGGLTVTAATVLGVEFATSRIGAVRSRWVVNAAEQITKSAMEVRWGAPGARIVQAAQGASLGAFVVGAGVSAG